METACSPYVIVSFTPHFKGTHGVRLTGDSELAISVDPEADWQPVQDVPKLLPYNSCDGLELH